MCNEALQSQFGTKYNLPDTAICAGAEGRDACDVRSGEIIRPGFDLENSFFRETEGDLWSASKTVSGTRLELSALVSGVGGAGSRGFTLGCKLFSRG